MKKQEIEKDEEKEINNRFMSSLHKTVKDCKNIKQLYGWRAYREAKTYSGAGYVEDIVEIARHRYPNDINNNIRTIFLSISLEIYIDRLQKIEKCFEDRKRDIIKVGEECVK